MSEARTHVDPLPSACQPQPMRADAEPSDEAPVYLRGDPLAVVGWRSWAGLCQLAAARPDLIRAHLGREPDDLARPPCGTCVASHPDEHMTPARHPGTCEVNP